MGFYCRECNQWYLYYTVYGPERGLWEIVVMRRADYEKFDCTSNARRPTFTYDQRVFATKVTEGEDADERAATIAGSGEASSLCHNWNDGVTARRMLKEREQYDAMISCTIH